MNRSDFIKNIIGFFGISVLPQGLINEDQNQNSIERRVFTPKGNDFLDGDEFYGALVKHSKTDEVYDLIHNDIGSPQALEDIVNESLLVINRKRLPDDLQTDEVMQAFEEGIVSLDHAFNEQGYVVAQINRVAELSARIKHFVPVKDKNGEVFWEVLFKG